MKTMPLITIKFRNFIVSLIFCQTNRALLQQAASNSNLSLFESFPSDISNGIHVGNSLNHWMIIIHVPLMDALLNYDKKTCKRDDCIK